MSSYLCYILLNEKGNTYVGSTNNLTRRLRQHNGEIVGGAKSTKGKGPWKVFVTVECEDIVKAQDHSLNLSLEWHLRNPVHKSKPLNERRVYWGKEGRLKSIEKLKERFPDIHLRVNVVPDVL